MISLRLIPLILIHQFLVENHALENFTETQGLSFQLEIQRLIHNNPLAILLDTDESNLDLLVQDAVRGAQGSGSVIYTFNPWWRLDHRGLDLKPKLRASKTTPYQWIFICLIEEKRTKIRAEKYLEELLSIGNGREDRFLLVGQYNFLSTFMKSRPIEKFMNLMMLPTDKDVIYQRRFNLRNRIGSPRFKTITDFTSAFWYNGYTQSLIGQHFRISGTKFPPYLDVVYEGGKKTLMGQNYQIFNQGARYFNYSFEFNDDSSWKLTGVRHPNGTFDGVFGDVIYGKADIASVSTQTISRNGFADFVGPFGRAHLIFVFSPPETYLGKYAIFQSYTLDVWGLILTFYMLLVFLFSKALKLSMIKGSLKGINETTFPRALLTLWSLSFEQTLEKRPKGTRLLMILWVLFAIVIGTGYRSNMAAFISFPMPESKPKTFAELSAATNYRIYFDLSGVSAYTYFQESNNTIIKKLQTRLEPIVDTTACVVNAFVDQRTICIGWDFTLKMAASKNMSIPQLEFPLYQSTENIWAAWYTFALPKNSISTPAFQHIGQTSFEAGLTAFWRSRNLNRYRTHSMDWNKNQQNSTLNEKLTNLRMKGKSETKPLKVENFQCIFLVLLAGLFISFFRFLYEICQERLARWRKMKFYQNGGNLHIIQVEKSIPIDFTP